MASYTTVPTVVTADMWTAANHNTYVRDNFTYLYDELGKFNSAFAARLTLTTATPFPSADVTAATTIYLTPLVTGSLISLYDGSSRWSWYALTEISIKSTDTITGTLNATTTVTGLSSTAGLAVGMEITGTNIPANTTIATIASATSITMNNAATGSGSSALTFKVPASRPVDVFVYNNSGTPKLEQIIWTSDSARATALTTQNGVDVKTGDTTRRLCGTYRTTGTAGQTEFSTSKRYVSNVYNRAPFQLLGRIPTADWTVGTSQTQRACNANTTEGQMRVGFVACLTDVAWSASMFVGLTAGASDQRNLFAIGLNSTTATYSSSYRACGVLTSIPIFGSGFASTIGYNYLQMQESSQSGGGMTVNGDSGGAASGYGLDAIVWL